MNRILQLIVVLAMTVGVVTWAGCSGHRKEQVKQKQAQAELAKLKGAQDGPKTTTKPEITEKTVNEKEQSTAKNPVVIIETSMGTIKAELWADKAPGTTTNFMRYVDEKYYDGLIFHRVIAGFMIQGGGFTPEMRQKPTHEQIKNEASANKPNARGTLAMARTSDVHSATAQFFINHADNKFLDHKDKTARGFGYCAFGRVIEGMDVVDKIAKVRTGNSGPHQNVPVQPVVIKSIRRAE